MFGKFLISRRQSDAWKLRLREADMIARLHAEVAAEREMQEALAGERNRHRRQS